MRSIDGLSGSRRTRQLTPEPATSRRVARAPKRAIAGGVVILGALVLGLVLIRPGQQSSEASQLGADTERAQESTGAADLTPEASDLLPTPGRFPQGSGVDVLPDDLVVLDTPTTTSLPQSDTASETQVSAPAATEPSHDFTVRILNGGGQAGAAATLRDQLTAAGYEVLSVGNAKNAHAQTTVYHETEKRALAETVAKDLGEPPVAFTSNAIAAPADILIVIGADRS